MYDLEDTVTAAHFTMNTLLIGTSFGSVYAYRVAHPRFLVDLDFSTWSWRTKTPDKACINCFDDVYLLNEELRVCFSTRNAVYNVPMQMDI